MEAWHRPYVELLCCSQSKQTFSPPQSEAWKGEGNLSKHGQGCRRCVSPGQTTDRLMLTVVENRESTSRSDGEDGSRLRHIA